jgi:hypothetical protein
MQGLPEKAPCTPLPEQEFGTATITESPAASQIIHKVFKHRFGRNLNFNFIFSV